MNCVYTVHELQTMNPVVRNMHMSETRIRKERQKKRNHCSLVKTAAIPIPEPIHMLVTKTFAPVSFATG